MDIKFCSLAAAFMLTVLATGCGQSATPSTGETAKTTEARTMDQTIQTDPKQYSAEQFFRSTSYTLASHRAFSHDGSKLLVGSDETGVFNAWTIDLSTGDFEPLTTSTTESVFPVSYFPNDDRVLYRADSGGNEILHVYVLDSDEATDLTPGDQVRALFSGWSKDGERFYVETNERNPQAMDLYEYNASDYSRRRVFENDGSFFVADVHMPYVALQKEVSNADSDVYVVDTSRDDAEPVLVTPHVGDISHEVHTFTPDGRALVYSTNEGREFQEAWQYELASGEKSLLVRDEWNVLAVNYSDDNRYRVDIINEDATIKASVRRLPEGKPVQTDLPEGDLIAFRFSPDGAQAAALIATDTSPPDVFTVALGSGDSRRWTTALNDDIDEEDLVMTEVVRYPSFDELDIPAILYRPHGASARNRVPALVWVHGGPGGQSIRGYNATIQHLVNHGYAVFAVNNRGSSGYGKTFFHMDDKKHGEVDLDDVVHGKKYLASLDWVDGSRIGIIGGSYGGYMVGAALAFRPHEFDVGINIFGVMNWVRTLKSIPAWWGPSRDSLYAELGDPAEEEERLRRISPLFHASNIIKPLLVVQGANDPRVLQVESDEIVEAVRANEVPVEYVLFDDEGHGFTKRENRIEASEAYVSFLEKHL